MAADDIQGLRVDMAGKASKEWVFGAFFLAIMAQFAGFLVIANMTVSPVKDDVTELKADVKGLLSASVSTSASLREISSSIDSANLILAGSGWDFSVLGAQIAKTGQAVDDFTNVWVSHPPDIKAGAPGFEAALGLYFQGLDKARREELINKLRNQ